MAGVGRVAGGRSGGLNKRSPEYHLAKGNYRPSVHGPLPPGAKDHRPADVVRMPEREPAAPTIPESGEVLVAQMVGEYAPWSPAELVTLVMAGRQLDRAHELRLAIAEAGGAVTTRRGTRSVSALVRAERGAMATYLALIKSLRLREET